MEMTAEDYIAHYGIKGMKWGVRNEVGLGGGIGAGVLTYKTISKKLAPKAEANAKQRYADKVIKMADKLADLNIDLFPGIEKELSRATPRPGSVSIDTISTNAYRVRSGQNPVLLSNAVKRKK